jgi:major membrane immunogen (membrane-anchored lipoprotein)
MKENIFVWIKLAILLIFGVMLISCGGTKVLRDGVYSGKSSADDDGARGEVTLTIAEGKIVDCRFVTRQKNGSLKDENWGKINGEISNRSYYDKAQLAVRAMDQYAESLRGSGDLRKVEAISGATISYNQFNEAVENALNGGIK